MNSGVTGSVLLPSFPRRRESTVPAAVSLLDYSLRSPFGPPYGRSTRFALLSRLRGNDGLTHTSLGKQRGAGTLMATVFLLLIIALLGGIGLRMAGTDINDTAVQNDSVEALFLAESGLERALQKLAAGTVCGAAVTDVAAQTLGRGTFQITSAAINAGLCRVQVLGSVGLAGTTPATRLIEADLSLGGCRGWAVGSASGGEVLLCWNGTSWSRSGPYPAIPDTTLRGVTCPASNDCWAVGSRSGGGLIAHWDGTTWSRVPTGSLPNENLYGVHCYDSNNCWAVGNNRAFVRWDGVSWSIGTYAPGFPNTRMNAVSCAAALDCWAVGDDTGGEVIAHWTGGSWSRVATSIAIPNAVLRSVGCQCHVLWRPLFRR
ncbi:MAG: hypothetical protein HZB57_09950 [Gammaproteobacteria bacterium]|nr:hypothetical protein [Gammaproteobacteria bacterium]